MNNVLPYNVAYDHMKSPRPSPLPLDPAPRTRCAGPIFAGFRTGSGQTVYLSIYLSIYLSMYVVFTEGPHIFTFSQGARGPGAKCQAASGFLTPDLFVALADARTSLLGTPLWSTSNYRRTGSQPAS